VDNRFPHHENEIAQSESATGHRFVNYWLHSGHLMIGGEQMHKSVGNVVYLKDLLAKGWDPGTIRLFLIGSRYRDTLDLVDDSLAQARAQRLRLQESVMKLKAFGGAKLEPSPLADEFLSQFESAMDDDLNTPAALASVFAFVRRVNQLVDEK